MLRTPRLPVAQYLRMSTEHQQYSTANQSVAILQYAHAHDMEIVRTYADHGKSGLSLATRTGLQQLLREAVAPGVDFQAILVFDVSRFGRFQNPDQAASYEYTLHQANIPIHYCAEEFQNDGSLASAILKTLKRGMAGEYSRELSHKVWAGHRRITELGYKTGGYAGYGLRRQLVGQDGTLKQVLSVGDRKSLQSEHVILIPGPIEEIAVVHRIYAMYIEQSLSEREIANQLNTEAVPWIGERPWTRMCVRHILANPKYIGASVYNRKSFKLQKRVVFNPREQWIYKAGAFEAVVPEARFEQAREIAFERAEKLSPEDMIAGLKALIARSGRASQRMIDAAKELPCAGSYISHFGSLRNAYRMAGWKPEHQLKHLRTERIVRETQERLVCQMGEALSDIGARMIPNKRTCVFQTESGVAVSLVTTRCTRHKGLDYWYIYSRENMRVHLRVVARLKPENDGLLDFFIFPNGVLKDSRLSLGTWNTLRLDCYRFKNLNIIAALLRRSEVEDMMPNKTQLAVATAPPTSELWRLADLAGLRTATALLVADEDFRNLIRAEGFAMIPDVLRRQHLTLPEQLLGLSVAAEYVTQLRGNARVKRFIEARHGLLCTQLVSVAGQNENAATSK